MYANNNMPINNNKTVGTLLVIQSLLIFVPMYILGTVINWPDSLNFPADQILPLIHSRAAEVSIGYFIYFIYSILFLFTGSLLASNLNKNGSKILKVASISAGLSSLARVIGILRWLIPFPILAASYVVNNNPTSRFIQETVYTVLNNYGGGIGELLGVTVFASIWSAIVSWQFICRRELPSWLGYFGFAATLASVSLVLEVFGVIIPVSIAQTLFHLWMLAMGIYFLRKKN
jgi:Domain of unknown function (DUF4386)